MKDFSFWTEYEGASEGSGRSEKIWLMNPDTSQTGLFKMKKDAETTDHISECIAYKLAELLNLSCARFELGTYLNREGSMSYNIIDSEGMILIEGLSILSLAFPDYDPDKFVDEESGMRYSLEMIETSLKPFGLFNDFLNIPIFDYLIGNTDRHHSNWALILKEDGKFCMSPLYDNSSSLCAYISKKKWDMYLGKDQTLWNSLVDTKSKSIIRINGSDKEKPTHLEVMKRLKNDYPIETKILVDKIILNVTEDKIYAILEEYEDALLPDKKRQIIVWFLLSKVEMLKNLYLRKEE